MANTVSSDYVVKNVMLLKKDTCSVRELVAWVNEQMQTDIRELSELKTGGIYCQFIHKLFPSSISLNKVNLFTNATFEIDANFKLLRSIFAKLNIRKEIPYRELVKGRGHYEFLNWFRKFHDVNDNGRPYDAIGERKGKRIGLRRVVETEKRVDYSKYLRRCSTIFAPGSTTSSNSVEVVPRAQSLIISGTATQSKKVKATPAKTKTLRKTNLPNTKSKKATESPITDKGKKGTKVCPNAPKAPKQSQPVIEAVESKTESIPQKLNEPNDMGSKSISLDNAKSLSESADPFEASDYPTMKIQSPIDFESNLPDCGNDQIVPECVQINSVPMAHSTPIVKQKREQKLRTKPPEAMFIPYDTPEEINIEPLEELPVLPIFQKPEKYIIQDLEMPPGEPVASKVIPQIFDMIPNETNYYSVQTLSDTIHNAAAPCEPFVNPCEFREKSLEKSLINSSITDIPTTSQGAYKSYYSIHTHMTDDDYDWCLEDDDEAASALSSHKAFINPVADQFFTGIMNIDNTPFKSVCEQIPSSRSYSPILADNPGILDPYSKNVFKSTALMSLPPIRNSGLMMDKESSSENFKKDHLYRSLSCSTLPSDSDSEDEKDDHIWDVRRQIVLLKEKLVTVECILLKYSWSSRLGINKIKRYLRKQKLDEPFVLGNIQK